MTNNKNRKKSSKKNPFFLIAVLLVILGFGYFFLNNKDSGIKPSNTKVGPVNQCRKNPAFVSKLGMKEPVLIDFRQKEVSGFQLMEARENGKVIRMPTWDDAGHLGPYAVDRNGNIYTAPVPYVSISENPPTEQNKLFKVNTNDGKMKEFMSFSDGGVPDNNNPFGVLGIAYDCDTESIYASSVAGSTMKEQKGIIYRIDPDSKEIMSRVVGFDALGIGIFNTAKGKKMFMGSARTPEIFSIYLDEKGDFIGKPGFEFSLAAQEGGSYDNAHRIRFSKNNEMEIKAIEFSYSLIASSDPLRNIYKFSYNAENDSWSLISVEKQQQ